jgi:hypothetical protein
VAVWDRQPALLGWSVAFVALAGGVVLLRRRYLRRLDEIARARDALRREIRGLTPQSDRERGS